MHLCYNRSKEIDQLHYSEECKTMNEQERKILFRLLVDLFIDGKQENKSSQQEQGEYNEKVSTRKTRRSTELNTRQATTHE